MSDAIARALSALQAIDPGCPRDEWVKIGMAAKDAGLSVGDFITWSETAGNYGGAADCKAAWKSFKPGKVTAATLFDLALKAGWTDPQRDDDRERKPQQKRQEARKTPGKAARPTFDFRAAWEAAEPATEAHPYIQRKLGLPAGLRVHHGPEKVAGQVLDGALLVPVLDAAGKLQSWQAIPPEGKKVNAPGAPIKGGSFVVGGPVRDNEVVFITEGIGDAWSAHQATRKPAMVAFGAGNVETIADQARAQFPGAHIVLVCDRGKEALGERVARAVRGAWVEMPADWPGNAGINDVHVRDGMAAVAVLLERKRRPGGDDDEIDGEALLALELPEVHYLCRPWIPEGVTILAGRPKIGKTTLLRQVAVSSASGADLWGSSCTQTEVLFLSLEEGQKLMRRKLILAGYTGPQLRRILFHWKWRHGAEGIADIREKLRANPSIRLVIVDSLTRFRDAPTRDKPQFHQDYEAVRLLADVAKDHAGLSIIVLHHTKKDQGDDPIADISGTFGLTAAADNFMVMRREGGEYALHCGGRYWDEPEDAFRLRREAGVWALDGSAPAVRLSPMQRDYLDALRAEGVVTTRGMARRFGVKDSTASGILRELQEKGQAERTADGWRAAGVTSTTETPKQGERYVSTETSETSEVGSFGSLGSSGDTAHSAVPL